MKFKSISDIHYANIEISSRCNAACPFCSRNYNGYGVRDNFPLRNMTQDEFSKIMDPVLGHPKFFLDFSGTYGDPCINPDFKKILEYVSKKYPHVKINVHTNGGMHKSDWWQDLAQYKMIQIDFALDGLADTHGIYRQRTDWHRVIENATSFIQAGGNATWQFIKFKHNEHQQEECRQLAKELGFKTFKVFDDNRDTGPAYTPDGEPFAIGDYTEKLLPVEEFVAQEKQFQIEYQKNNQQEFVRELDSVYEEVDCWALPGKIYVAVNGDVWPCCWLGGTFPLTSDTDNGWQLKKLPLKINAFEYSLNEIFASWQSIADTWTGDEPLSTCVKICGKCSDYSGQKPKGEYENFN